MGPDSSDPRRADRAVPFVLKPLSADELPPDYYALCSLLFALFAVLLKIEMYSWMTLLFVLGSFANTAHSTMDTRAMLASVALVVLVFMATHIKAGSAPLILPGLARWLRGL